MRRRNIVLSFSHNSVTTARLKTYNVHLDIGAHWAIDQMGCDRQGWQKNKRSREPRPTGAAEEQEITEGCEKKNTQMKNPSHASRIPSIDQSPTCHSAEWKTPLSSSPAS
ncbi:hypothetical protein TNCV_2377891 [Trichonephila clavipes]|nr:hypothetical protein TNCV_2377891 [Trichonephila clavipes]